LGSFPIKAVEGGKCETIFGDDDGPGGRGINEKRLVITLEEWVRAENSGVLLREERITLHPERIYKDNVAAKGEQVG